MTKHQRFHDELWWRLMESESGGPRIHGESSGFSFVMMMLAHCVALIEHLLWAFFPTVNKPEL